MSAKHIISVRMLDYWIRNLRFEDREKFVDCLFILLENADMGTYEKMTSNWLESAKEIIKSYSNMSSDVKKVLNRAVSVLFESVNENRKAAGGEGKRMSPPKIIKKIDKKIRKTIKKE